MKLLGHLSYQSWKTPRSKRNKQRVVLPRLYFVVPRDKFYVFQLQDYIGVDGKKLLDQSAVVDQFALCVDVSAGSRAVENETNSSGGGGVGFEEALRNMSLDGSSKIQKKGKGTVNKKNIDIDSK